MGLEGKILQAIKSLHENVESNVRINDNLSDFFNVSSGLKQGCLLSPLLFSVFINDTVRKVNALGNGVPLSLYEQISILIYADDIALIAESEENMQDMQDLLGDWCQEWGLKVNPKKSEIIHFRNPSVQKTPFQFTCGNLELRVVTKSVILVYGLMNT